MVSFETPEYTANADAIGTLRLLEAIKVLGRTKKTKFYQASTSELFGNSDQKKQNEKTPFVHKVLMLSPNYILIGLQRIIEMRMVFLHQMVFYLITKDQQEEKTL